MTRLWLAVALVLGAAVPAAAQSRATLTLQRVFGAPASSLILAFSDVDATCTSAPALGVTCVRDPAATAATWHGTIQLGVRITGPPFLLPSARLVGLRPALGSIPAGRIVDGPAPGAPVSPYPVTPAAPIVLRSGIGRGNSTITRSLGLRVVAADPAGPWSGRIVYSLVVE